MELGLIGRFIRHFSKKKSQTFSMSGTFPLYFSQEKNGDEIYVSPFLVYREEHDEREKNLNYTYINSWRENSLKYQHAIKIARA